MPYKNVFEKDTEEGIKDNCAMRETQYVGHQFSEPYVEMFSDKNIKMMSKKITQLLTLVNPPLKVDENGRVRPIAVPDTTIKNLLYTLYENYRWRPQDIIDYAIEVIYSQIKNEMMINKQNKNLSAWVLQYNGDHGIRRYPKIKLRERRPTQQNFIPPRY